MSNVVRLVNGGSIQVRTGVIQGIGPQGPRGVAGNQGADGPAGPTGDQGPIGQILERSALTKMGTSNPLAANTDTVISFGSVPYDAFIPNGFSLSAITLSAGDYLLSVWLRFDDAAAGLREVWFKTGTSTIARTSRQSVVGAVFYVDLAFPFKAAGGEVVNVLARSAQATAVSDGAWSVVRTGSGPPGPTGPTGPQGPIGPNGAKGDQGVAGTANAGFTKYGDLLPH